jgi:integrase
MAVFGRAVRYELIERNVIKLAAPVPKHKPKGPERNHTRALTDGEARRLLAFAHAEPLYNENGLDVADLVEIMLLTGVRIGEALAMRWLDVQLGQPALASVGGTIKRIAGEGLIRQVGTKSDAGMRDVDLSPRAVQVLTGRRPAMHDRLAPVFPSAVGGWRDPSNTNKQIRRLLDDVDLAWVTPHTFRRTFLTRLGDLGVPLRQIADMAGHANPAMTARHYLGRQGARRELQAALTSFDYG